jgi:hypothetical protein
MNGGRVTFVPRVRFEPRPCPVVGDLAIYCGRLVEVAEVGSSTWAFDLCVVEFTDGGGIKRRFKVDRRPPAPTQPLRILQADQVLDTMAELGDESAYAYVRLTTERWMADPRPGDLFFNSGLWVVVDDVAANQVKVREADHVRFDLAKGGWQWEEHVYPSAAAFREDFFADNEPGYIFSAHSSRRTGEVPVSPIP